MPLSLFRRQPSGRLSTRFLYQTDKLNAYRTANTFFELPVIKVWNGVKWVYGIVRTWNNSYFIESVLKVFRSGSFN